MPFKEMKIAGAWIYIPTRLVDGRGHFEEQFKHSHIEAELGREFVVRQVNQSVSHRGVVRGIHSTFSELGQAKYVSCAKGALLDVVVDLRPNSSTFGLWDSIEITEKNGISVLLSEGLGHAFMSLEDGSVATYLCTSEYDQDSEVSFNPLTSEVGDLFREVAKEKGIGTLTLSQKDQAAAPLFTKSKQPGNE